MVRWMRVLVVIVVVLFAIGGIGIAGVGVPYQQNIVWYDIVPDEGETFPEGTLQHFVIDMHRSDAPDTWWDIITTDPEAPDGVEQLKPFDVPKDGFEYEFRTVPFVHWPTGEVEELEPCLSGWVKALKAHNGGCEWEAR